MSLVIACVKWGTAYQAAYVNRLYAMVARNLADRTPGRFVCFTDDPEGIWPQVEIKPLPEGVGNWWSKLALFAPDAFAPGDRVLYIDLDTLIIGPLDDIAAYDGFAMLRDFYYPERPASGVMAWRAGELSAIWSAWLAAGKPEPERGDQEWIESCLPALGVTLEFWPDLFPGVFCSFKEDCKPFPPETARVVCFHGDPKPEDCGRSWVREIWKEGDGGAFHSVFERNTAIDTVKAQCRASAARDLPGIAPKPARDGEVLIIGGGPSLADTLHDLRRRYANGAHAWALNGAYDWLAEREITPHAMVVLDARPENARFVQSARSGSAFYVASQCHPSVYDALVGRRIVRFDLDIFGDAGTTVGTHALCLAYLEGFRKFHLYGFDSSYRDEAGHAYVQPLNDGERIVDVHCGDRVFRAAPWMMQQARDFQALARDMLASDPATEITVHGDGLLPYLAHLMAHPVNIAA